MSDKIFLTFEQQITRLKDRGLVVTDSTKKVLESENYYNIINGYKYLFIDKTSGLVDKFKTGTQFDEIKALYDFDFELKSIILKRILKVENYVKTQIAYIFSQKYGYRDYMKIENFDYEPGSAKTSKDANKIKAIFNLINTVDSKIASQFDKHPSIKHYMLEYGYVPLWVAVNVLPLGSISIFYSMMKQKDKQQVAKYFNVSDGDLDTMLTNVTRCRNKCAHGEILYNFKSSTEIKENKLHTTLAIPKINDKLAYGNNDLFSIIIIMKLFLDKNEFDKLIEELKSIIDTLKEVMKTISIDEILNQMGFIGDWGRIATIS